MFKAARFGLGLWSFARYRAQGFGVRAESYLRAYRGSSPAGLVSWWLPQGPPAERMVATLAGLVEPDSASKGIMGIVYAFALGLRRYRRLQAYTAECEVVSRLERFYFVLWG